MRTIRDLAPPPDSIWRCPCGYENKYGSVVTHRKGYKKRPACAKGRIQPVDPSLLYGLRAAEALPDEPPVVQSIADPIWMTTAEAARYLGINRPSVIARVERGRMASTERDGKLLVNVVDQPRRLPDESDEEPPDEGAVAAGDDPGTLDTEEIARRLNAERGIGTAVDLLAGFDGDGLGGDLPPGDWQLEPSSGMEPVSQARETVQLPVSVRIMYDYLRGRGWHEGDGGLSAFITAIVLDYWENVLGLQIVVVEKEDIDGGRHGDERLSQQGDGRQASAVAQRQPSGR